MGVCGTTAPARARLVGIIGHMQLGYVILLDRHLFLILNGTASAAGGAAHVEPPVHAGWAAARCDPDTQHSEHVLGSAVQCSGVPGTSMMKSMMAEPTLVLL